MSTADFYVEQGIDPTHPPSMDIWMAGHRPHVDRHPLPYHPVVHPQTGLAMGMMPPIPPMMMAPPPGSPSHHHPPHPHHHHLPPHPRPHDPAWPLNEMELDGMAYSLGWIKILEVPLQPPMASYRRDHDGSMIRLNFWLSTGTVGSYLDHPMQGKKTQLFRRHISMPEAYAIFENPRLHTGRGYHQRQHHHHSPSKHHHQRQRRPCRYGVHCHNVSCRFQHPSGFVPQPKPQQQQLNKGQSQRGGGPGGGGNGGSRGPCRYGARCTRSDCWFEHPDGKADKTDTPSCKVVPSES